MFCAHRYTTFAFRILTSFVRGSFSHRARGVQLNACHLPFEFSGDVGTILVLSHNLIKLRANVTNEIKSDQRKMRR